MNKTTEHFEDTVNYSYLRSLFDLKSQNSFEFYLENVFNDICSYKNNTNIGISKIRFIDLLKLPVIICEKLFNSFDFDKDRYLSHEEFKNSLSGLYFGTFEQTAQIIFNLYDFDQDGVIVLDDVKTVLAFLPLKSDKTKIEYKYQYESLEELNEILQTTFKKSEELRFKEFLEVIQTKSDIYLQLLCYLYQRCPFKEISIKVATTIHGNKINSNKSLKLISVNKIYASTGNIFNLYANGVNKDKDDDIKLTKRKSPGVVLRSPSIQTRFSPVCEYFSSKMISSLNLNEVPKEKKKKLKEELYDENDLIKKIKSNNYYTKENEYFNIKMVKPNRKDSFSEINSIEISGLKGMIRLNNTGSPLKESVNKKDNEEFKILNPVNPARRLSSFGTNNIKTGKSPIKDYLDLNLIEENELSPRQCDNSKDDITDNREDSDGCNNEIIDFPESEDNSSFPFDLIEKRKSQKKKIFKKQNSIESNMYESLIYLSVSEMEGIQEIWMVLIGQDLYYYTNSTKKESTSFHHLSGCFVRENGEMYYKGETYYSFSIIFSNKTRTYFSKDRDKAKEWTLKLRHCVGYQNFFDFYEMIDDLDEGHFGVIKLGVHIKTNQKVAIKILHKAKMTEKEIELMQREIDILKICKHPNIVRFLDHFENSEYIFIVMEYLKYGSLKDYLDVCIFLIYQFLFA